MDILSYVRIAARTAFAIVNNLYSIPAYVVWMMALRLVRPLYAPIYWRIEGLMYHWLLAMVSMWSYTAGYESHTLYRVSQQSTSVPLELFVSLNDNHLCTMK